MMDPDHPPSTKEIAEHYDSLGEFYREVWGNRLHHGYWVKASDSTEEAIQNLEKTVIDLAGICHGDRVFDVGSGYGTLALRLARELQAEVTGWTLSPQQHLVAKASASQLDARFPSPTFHCADWTECDLPPDSSEAVISIECLSHIADQRAFFRKASRVLRSGGRLVIADWAAPAGIRSWQRRWLLEPICFEGRLARLANLAEWTNLAEEMGFCLVEKREISSQVRKTWRVIIFRLIHKLFCDARYRRFLQENLRSERIFALTLARLLVAYYTGALQYGIVGFEKSKSPHSFE